MAANQYGYLPRFLNPFIGDTGSGGQEGLVPPPPPGSGPGNLVLRADGTFGSSGAGGVNTVGPIDGIAPSDDALIIDSDVLYAQSASQDFPGMITINDQTFSGEKSFLQQSNFYSGIKLFINDFGTLYSQVVLSDDRVFTTPDANSNSVQPLEDPVSNQWLQFINADGTQITAQVTYDNLGGYPAMLGVGDFATESTFIVNGNASIGHGNVPVPDFGMSVKGRVSIGNSYTGDSSAQVFIENAAAYSRLLNLQSNISALDGNASFGIFGNYNFSPNASNGQIIGIYTSAAFDTSNASITEAICQLIVPSVGVGGNTIGSLYGIKVYPTDYGSQPTTNVWHGYFAAPTSTLGVNTSLYADDLVIGNDLIIIPTHGAYFAGAIMSQTESHSFAINTGGDIALVNTGKKIMRKSGGTDATCGFVTLSAGSATVNTTAITANSFIKFTNNQGSGTIGNQWVATRTVGTSFVITSASGSDTSVIGWEIDDFI